MEQLENTNHGQIPLVCEIRPLIMYESMVSFVSRRYMRGENGKDGLFL